MKTLFKINLLAIFLMLSLAGSMKAQQDKGLFHITPYAGLRFYNWVENLETGDKLLEEDG